VQVCLCLGLRLRWSRKSSLSNRSWNLRIYQMPKHCTACNRILPLCESYQRCNYLLWTVEIQLSSYKVINQESTSFIYLIGHCSTLMMTSHCDLSTDCTRFNFFLPDNPVIFLLKLYIMGWCLLKGIHKLCPNWGTVKDPVYEGVVLYSQQSTEAEPKWDGLAYRGFSPCLTSIPLQRKALHLSLSNRDFFDPTFLPQGWGF